MNATSMSLPVPLPRPINGQAASRCPPRSPIGVVSPTVGRKTTISGGTMASSVPAVVVNKHGQQAPEMPPRSQKQSVNKSSRPSLVATLGGLRTKKQSIVQEAQDSALLHSAKSTSTLPSPVSSRRNSQTRTNFSPLDRKLSNNPMDSLLRRPSSQFGSELSRRTSALTLPFSLRKPSVNSEPVASERRTEYLKDKKSTSDLSASLSFAKVQRDQSQRGTASGQQRKKSENLFTKKEMKSIRLAATEAKVNWDEELRITSDDTSLSGSDSQSDVLSPSESFRTRATLILGRNNSIPDRRKPSTTSVATMYGADKQAKFEFHNPQVHMEHQYGMIVFSGGGGSMVLEDDE